MSHPIDVGSVLGGRYKVTATVLTSHDQDLVLDGVDQVLNRAVSILVAGPGQRRPGGPERPRSRHGRTSRQRADPRPWGQRCHDLPHHQPHLGRGPAGPGGLLQPALRRAVLHGHAGQRNLRPGPLPRTRNLRRPLRRRRSRRRLHQLRAEPAGRRRHPEPLRPLRRRPRHACPRVRHVAGRRCRRSWRGGSCRRRGPWLPRRRRRPQSNVPRRPHRRRPPPTRRRPSPSREARPAPADAGSAAAGTRRNAQGFPVVRRRLRPARPTDDRQTSAPGPGAAAAVAASWLRRGPGAGLLPRLGPEHRSRRG